MSDAPEAEPDKAQRSIRSFVIRQGRATASQKRAFEQHWDNVGVNYTGQLQNLDALFAKPGEIVFELGFGNAEQLLFSVEQEPQRNFIGVEVHAPGVGRALNGIAQNALSNVRIYQHDAVQVLQHEIPDAALSEIRIYFPDPWHKKRHHKRRIIQPEFVALLCRKLKPSGLLHLASDWQEYIEHMWEVCDNEPMLNNSEGPGGFVARPAWRRQTHFETRGQNLGHGVWDLLYTKRGA